MKKTSFVLIAFLIILSSKATLAIGHNVEIFDPRDEKVVKIISLNDEIRTMISDWALEVDELYPYLNPLKDDGYAVKFPIDPPIKSTDLIGGQFLNEMYLIIPETNPPLLLIFTEKDMPGAYVFPGDLDKLSEVLDFNLRDF